MSLLSIYLFVYLFVCLLIYSLCVFLDKNVKQQEITSIDLRSISKEIIKKRFRLGRALGVADSDLEEIKEKYRRQILDQSFRILKKWKDNKGRGATFRTLAQALLDRTVVLKSVLEKFCLEDELIAPTRERQNLYS